MPGILGQKVGMARILNEKGELIPVSVIKCEPNKIVQIKTTEREGYAAVLSGFLPKRKPTKTKKFKHVAEFRLPEDSHQKVGDEISVAAFTEQTKVRITGFSRGRGFSGVIKRHKFSRGPESHGSHHHRQPGSSGGAVSGTGRVPKGKRFPGHFGCKRVTKNAVPIMLVDNTENLIVVKGPIPGAAESLVEIRTM